MINVKSKMAGRFMLHKAKADAEGNEIPGTREVVADWFDNLLLTSGLNYLGSNIITSALTYVQVGDGSSAPLEGNTSLNNLVAATLSTQDSVSGAQTDVGPYYVFSRVKKRFAAGVAAGNLSEVGAGWGSSNGQLLSRALILDNLGDPTTITVLNDEILDVSYEFRIYPPSGDVTGTIILDGETYDYTARACKIGNADVNGWSFSESGVEAQLPIRAIAYSGAIADVFSNPSGTSDGATTATNGTYSNNSLQGSCTYLWGLGDGNIAGGIRSVALPVGWTRWQIEFANQVGGGPIPKDNTQELTLTVSHSWARGSN